MNRLSALIPVSAAVAAALLTSRAIAATPDASATAAWRGALTRATLPANGCFKAEFPERSWTRVACQKAPSVPYAPPAFARSIPRHANNTAGGGQTVGDGNDYQAVVTHVISQGEGSFPSISGVTSETDGGKNVYSLQLNSNFMSGSKACATAAQPSSCLAWQQFVYSSSSKAVFMQYWLIDYNKACPSGFMKYSTDCYGNSAAVSAPKISIKQLGTLSVTGTAAAGGTDKMVFTHGTTAYTTTGSDNVVYLASGWTGAEWNVIGDGNGSGATFNRGSSITAKIALTDSLTAAPSCEANDGTTGETNNLTLGSCSTFSGSVPSVTFTESN